MVESKKQPPEKIDDTPIGLEMGVSGKEKDNEDKNMKRFNENFKKASAQQDIIDEIYFEKDPISTSLIQRKQKGKTITTVVREPTHNKQGRFFFTLRLRGPGEPPIVKEVKEMNSS